MRITLIAAVAAALGALAAQPARADAETDKLRSEVEKLRTEVDRLASQHSAESALSTNSAVHLAGYGHVGYSDREGVPGSFNEVGFNPIFHYQYKNLLLFETELEIMANADGEADFGLEYANMNLFASDHLVLFGGKFLSPIGYFIQNLHPAWINKFPSKPPGFQEEGGAVPVSDIGAGARGAFPLGGMRANYTLYVGNGPRLELNAAGDEIEAIVNTGATSNVVNRKLVGGRVGLLPAAGLELGVSGGLSRVAVDASEGDRSYSVAGVDASYKWRSLDLRGEYLRSKVGDLATSVAPAGGAWKTYYLQAAYRFPDSKWEPVLRYGKFTSPHADQSQKQIGIGIDYWLESNVVAKAAFERNQGDTPETDADRVLLQLAFGF